MKDVLITGSTGFVGKNLMTYIKKWNINTYSVDRRKHIYNEPCVTSIKYESFWNGTFDAKTYIHLAGKAHDLKKKLMKQNISK